MNIVIQKSNARAIVHWHKKTDLFCFEIFYLFGIKMMFVLLTGLCFNPLLQQTPIHIFYCKYCTIFHARHVTHGATAILLCMQTLVKTNLQNYVSAVSTFNTRMKTCIKCIHKMPRYSWTICFIDVIQSPTINMHSLFSMQLWTTKTTRCQMPSNNKKLICQCKFIVLTKPR